MENAKRELMLGRTALGPDVADIDSLQFHTEAPRQKTRDRSKSQAHGFPFLPKRSWRRGTEIAAKVIMKDKDITDQYLSQHRPKDVL